MLGSMQGNLEGEKERWLSQLGWKLVELQINEHFFGAYFHVHMVFFDNIFSVHIFMFETR
jgi:hypothetical protein